ncbi:glycoside hydrolase family 78 protein [Paenibacillus sp. LHD-38]|uniref:glycoside hydrolase family 78 protein n=1 Tax=Paenibacillus sp. LHD-38 TaxID=3072143 RepID=UPI0028103DEE|nr:glycoside hydrolase family 78 protein [Paenibacillus sp. LHD-38]MDQ8737961.1 glycoside hydrolase family 78 protein [Paenibacillus sp. LHD-38]
MTTLRVIACKTEYAHNPLGLDLPSPRLFWRLAADDRAVKQQAYRILVASSEEKLALDQGDMWDSGVVTSDRSTHISYDGSALRSGERYYWKVRVWDDRNRLSEWSEPAYWTMGLLSRGEWKASWIGRKSQQELDFQPTPYMRKSFFLAKKIRRATIYATALGLYRLSVNGNTVSDHFAPGWTDYDKRVQVYAYDITDMLRAGDNAFGVILGDGWYAGTVGFLGRHVYGERPFFLLQAVIEYADGGSERIVTDGSWRTGAGPIRYSDMIKGETYDARLERSGWDEPGFDDSEWEMPDLRSGYNGLLSAGLEPPVTIAMTIEPISVRKTGAGTFIYDMGQNMVGWSEVTVQGEAGTRITLSHAEMLNPDGSLYLDNLRVAVQQDHYILKGIGTERYEPLFTFHGFRYVELIDYPGEADLTTITGKVVHSGMPVNGSLVTSDPMVNKLYSNIVWGQRGNFLSVPTDCPQRDERLGWTGDAQIFARTASYNMDVSRFFTKYMRDIVDAQLPSGAFTDVAPDAGWIRHKMWNTRLNWFAPDNAGWGDAGVIIPWTLYLMYGDTRILEENYEAMKRWVSYLKANSSDLIRPDYANYGDWLSIDADTPNEVLATAYFGYSTKLLADIAGVLGRTEDRSRYGTLFEEIAEAFRSEFVSGDGFIRGDTQTVYVLALQFGLLTEKLRLKATSRLTENIKARGNRLSTGFLGVGYLLPALTESGELDIAYELLTQEAFPSWMYSIKHGATTIWERWDGWTEEKGFQTPSMNSFNHYSLGSVGEWMFRYMAGIEADPADPGFRHAIIRPRPGGRLNRVKAEYESLYGTISVEWKLENDNRLELEVEVPANASATVYVPGAGVISDGEDRGNPAAGCALLTQEEYRSIYRLGSGKYRFTSTFGAASSSMLNMKKEAEV